MSFWIALSLTQICRNNALSLRYKLQSQTGCGFGFQVFPDGRPPTSKLDKIVVFGNVKYITGWMTLVVNHDCQNWYQLSRYKRLRVQLYKNLRKTLRRCSTLLPSQLLQRFFQADLGPFIGIVLQVKKQGQGIDHAISGEQIGIIFPDLKFNSFRGGIAAKSHPLKALKLIKVIRGTGQ